MGACSQTCCGTHCVPACALAFRAGAARSATFHLRADCLRRQRVLEEIVKGVRGRFECGGSVGQFAAIVLGISAGWVMSNTLQASEFPNRLIEPVVGDRAAALTNLHV